MVFLSVVFLGFYRNAWAQTKTQLSLAQVFERVEQFDPQVREKAYALVRAQVDLRRARWNRVRGSLKLNASEAITESNWLAVPSSKDSDSVFFDRFSMELAAEINVPLFAGFGIQGAIAAAEYRQTAAQAQLKMTKRDLKRLAYLAYASLIVHNQNVVIGQQALARSQKILEIAQSGKKSGVKTESDVVRAELNYLSKKEDFISRQAERDLSLNTLKAALLMQDVEVIEPTLSIQDLIEYKLTGVASERLELTISQAQMQAALKDKIVQRARYFPRIELFTRATYGNGSALVIGGSALGLGGGTQRFGVFSGYFTAGINLSFTGFDFFVTRDDVARADADAHAASARYQDQQRQMLKDKQDSKIKQEQAKMRLDALSGTQSLIQKSVDMVRANYASGNASLTDVLNAELEANQTSMRFLQVSLDCAQAHIDYLRAEGFEL